MTRTAADVGMTPDQWEQSLSEAVDAASRSYGPAGHLQVARNRGTHLWGRYRWAFVEPIIEPVLPGMSWQMAVTEGRAPLLALARYRALRLMHAHTARRTGNDPLAEDLFRVRVGLSVAVMLSAGLPVGALVAAYTTPGAPGDLTPVALLALPLVVTGAAFRAVAWIAKGRAVRFHREWHQAKGEQPCC